jgi:hypothetical protein
MVKVLKKEAKRVSSNICHCMMYNINLKTNITHFTFHCDPHAIISSEALNCIRAELKLF